MKKALSPATMVFDMDSSLSSNILNATRQTTVGTGRSFAPARASQRLAKPHRASMASAPHVPPTDRVWLSTAEQPRRSGSSTLAGPIDAYSDVDRGALCGDPDVCPGGRRADPAVDPSPPSRPQPRIPLHSRLLSPRRPLIRQGQAPSPRHCFGFGDLSHVYPPCSATNVTETDQPRADVCEPARGRPILHCRRTRE